MYPRPRAGLKNRLEAVQVTVDPNELNVEVIYIQPHATDGQRCIDFETFARHVERQGDELSLVFAQHLRNWSTPAGSAPPD